MAEKILVVSDSHGNDTNLKKAIGYFGKRGEELSLLIHLGDSQGTIETIKNMVDCPVEAVRGNCDVSGNLPGTKLISIGGETAMITHGHRYGCKSGTENMRELAKANGASIVLFGHTHIPMVETIDGMTVANPGSISYPRQEKRLPTYLVITLEDDGRKNFVVVTMHS